MKYLNMYFNVLWKVAVQSGFKVCRGVRSVLGPLVWHGFFEGAELSNNSNGMCFAFLILTLGPDLSLMKFWNHCSFLASDNCSHRSLPSN